MSKRFVNHILPLAATAVLTFSLPAAGQQEPAAVPPATPTAEAAPAPRLELGIGEAVLMAMENNRALQVQRLQPDIRRIVETVEAARFSPLLAAETNGGRETEETRAGAENRVRNTSAAAELSAFLPTGTTVAAEIGADRSWGTANPEQHALGAGISITQALLRGRGAGPNLASLRQAALDTQISEYELRGFAAALAAEVERTYWSLVLAGRQVEIFTASLELAEQQLGETGQRIRVGDLAETELAAGQAEVALRREALINAHSRRANLKVRLLRLLRPGALHGALPEILLTSMPAPAPLDPDPLEAHLELALRLRPELNQARLLNHRGDLEIERTRNGLLPRLDLFVSFGRTGYARSFSHAAADWDSDGSAVAAGVSFEMPLGNQAAKARHEHAVLTRRQTAESLANLEDLVREDVHNACIEIERFRKQVEATAATRRFQEEKLRAETAKFRVGRSTSLLVATAQRDLVASQTAEIEAVINGLQALTNLHYLDGSLLQRRGIEAPGTEPVAP